ncbi:MAG: type VI secretion system contractile sheath large subunit [Polyangiales bacterium]
MTTRLSFDLGPKGGRSQRRHDPETTRVLVIADLSGDARRGQAPGLDAARVFGITVDNFEQVLARIQPRVLVADPLGRDAERSFSFQALEDFHPDRLYDAVVNQLASAQPQPTAVQPQPTAAPSAGREGQSDMLERLLGTRPSGPVAAPATTSKISAHAPLDAMLRAIVAPHVIKEPTAPASGAPSNDALVQAMRSVLHAPAYQRVEAAWLALRWLVFENALGGSLVVHVLDASRADLLADLRACGGQLERSQLHRAVVREAAGGVDATPFSLVIADLGIAGREEDVSLLAGLGAVAAEAGACLLAGAEPPLWGCSDLGRQPERSDWSPVDPEVAARMQLLRASAVAPFIGLCMPRVLGRVPFGDRSDPVERFSFSELPENPPHAAFAWLNGAFAIAHIILAGVAERGWDNGPGTQLDLGDLPHVLYTAFGGKAVKPCAEVHLDDTSAERVLSYGLMPLMSYRNRNAVRLARLQSIADPPAPLALRD